MLCGLVSTWVLSRKTGPKFQEFLGQSWICTEKLRFRDVKVKSTNDHGHLGYFSVALLNNCTIKKSEFGYLHAVWHAASSDFRCWYVGVCVRELKDQKNYASKLRFAKKLGYKHHAPFSTWMQLRLITQSTINSIFH